MNSIKIGAIAAILLAGQAMAASTMTYTLEVGGNDQAAAWKNPAGCTNAQAFPVFTAGQTADGKTYNVGDIVTWAARVTVGGTVTLPSDPGPTADFPVRGAANMVMSLELRKDSATGTLVSIGQGSATTAGFFSAINNGVNNRGTCPALPQDPAPRAELAAFPVAWSLDAGTTYARVIDGTDFGGPLGGNNATTGSYYQYPTAAGYVSAGGVTATTPSGTLAGMGAGYTNFHFISIVSSATTTEGIGLTAETSPNCGAVLQDGPAFEGQINTSGLAAGTYYLTLVPGTGNNVLALSDNGFACLDPQDNNLWTGFAKAADTKTGDTITFVLKAPVVCTRTVNAPLLWYKGELASFSNAPAPDKTPYISGSGAATFASVSSFSKGINGLYIDFVRSASCPVLAVTAADFAFKYGNSNTPASWTALAAPTVAITPNIAANTDRVTLSWADNPFPTRNWLQIKILANGNTNLAADYVAYYGLLIGSTGAAASQNTTAIAVTSTDYNNCYSNRVNTFPGTQPLTNVYDFTRDRNVTSADYNLAYNERGSLFTAVKLNKLNNPAP